MKKSNGSDASDDAEPRDVDLQADAEIECPFCGEIVSITLDPFGGAFQEYTEDCEVCCQPWLIRVRYSDSGDATVQVEPAQ